MKGILTPALTATTVALLAGSCAPGAAPGPPGPAAGPERDTPAVPETPVFDAPRPVGRQAALALDPPPLVFDPPEASEHEILGVPVYHLHDPALPLVDVFVQLKGGVSHFPRREMGPVTAFGTLIRNGGTLELPPDSVDRRLDLLALQLGVSTGGGGSAYSLNSLTSTLDDGLELLVDLLVRPGFDPQAVEVWRGQELERVRRRLDAPGSLAYEEFNRLVFGDHPVGWVMEEADLAAEYFTPQRLRRLHRVLHCRDRLVVGVAGDLTWDEAERRVRAFLEEWPDCEEDLPDPPTPDMRTGGAVFVLPRDVEQSTIVMAHPGGLRLEDSPDFFASRVANLILGGGGFSSRLMARVRTERGLAYSASSLWTTPLRHEGLVGAVTATQPQRTVEAVRLVLEVLDQFRAEPPGLGEVERAVEQMANGYVFAFESARQIVGRRMGDRVQELPEGWLERYLEGIQAVTPDDVFRVASEHIDPGRMTILIVGDPERFDPGLEALGDLYRLHTDGTYEPWDEGTPQH